MLGGLREQSAELLCDVQLLFPSLTGLHEMLRAKWAQEAKHE